MYVEQKKGTAGVWRISAINESGGWKDTTTVEDMDLAVRASLKGWKFVYLHDLGVNTSILHFYKFCITSIKMFAWSSQSHCIYMNVVSHRSMTLCIVVDSL